jgi:RES domain-containing protein
MKAWRLARRKFAGLDGSGASLYGGRWNPSGRAVVYSSENLSLALLEIIVHLELALEQLPADYVKIEINVPQELKIETIEALPRTSAAMREIGRRWHEAGRSAALLVPSVIVMEEKNLLLNPAHRDFAKIRSARSRPFRIDEQLLFSA